VIVLVEEAYWYYKDIYRCSWPQLPSLNFKGFLETIFQTCVKLLPYHCAIENSTTYEAVVKEFKTYKMQLDVYGAILLSPDLSMTLLVSTWKAGNWGFPAGKIKAKESGMECAIRELREETSFDISQLINEEDCVTHSWGKKSTTLYIITGVPIDFRFRPQTRKEIRQIGWYYIADLPTYPPFQRQGGFWNVIPFVQPLRDWIMQRTTYRISET